MFPFRKTPRNVWLVTWEFTRNDYFRDLGCRRIAAVLDTRVSDSFVVRYVPLLYSTERELLMFEKYGEMHLQSCRRHKNPDWKDVRSEDGAIVFGGHPWLSARRVEGFFVDVLDYDTENVYWTEPARFRFSLGKPLEEITPQRQTMLKARRNSTGWDEVITYGLKAAPPTTPKEERQSGQGSRIAQATSATPPGMRV
jgi:hypothetical protein